MIRRLNLGWKLEEIYRVHIYDIRSLSYRFTRKFNPMYLTDKIKEAIRYDVR